MAAVTHANTNTGCGPHTDHERQKQTLAEADIRSSLIYNPDRNSIKPSLSAALPSELPQSPATGGRLDLLKQEIDDVKTPITPPLAYTDFLKALSPASSTPVSSYSPLFDRIISGRGTPLTQPSSAHSYTCQHHPYHNQASSASITKPQPRSTMSRKTHSTTEITLAQSAAKAMAAASAAAAKRPMSATSAPIIPPSPFMRPPRTPTTLKKLHIPESPLLASFPTSANTGATTAILRTPLTATAISSSISSASPCFCLSANATDSATSLRSPYPPHDWNIEKIKRLHETRSQARQPTSAVTIPSTDNATPHSEPVAESAACVVAAVAAASPLPAVHHAASAISTTDIVIEDSTPPSSPTITTPPASSGSTYSTISSTSTSTTTSTGTASSSTSTHPKSVSVRHVVTRTITFTRTAPLSLDPPPKGKKRKVGRSVVSSTLSPAPGLTPP